jgi:hypothetical protein
MWKQLGFSALVVGAGAVAWVATRPNSFHIERSALIAAPPDKVFAQLNDFRRWLLWSPYESLDAQLERSITGPDSGPGASYAYKGKKAGEGRMTILESLPGQRVVVGLDFLKPMPAKNRAIFELTSSGNGTQVRWIMEGPNTLLSKLMAPIVHRFIGHQLEQGLANLDRETRAESQRQATKATTGTDQPAAEPAPLH